MKAKILMVALLLTIAYMIVAPVMAQPPTVVQVTGTQSGGGVFSGIVLNDGGVFFYDAVGTGTANLHTPTADYTFTTSSILNGTINTKTDDGVMHYKMTWTYKVGSEVKGTFEGEINAKTTTYLYAPSGNPRPQFSTNVLHCVLQGSGDFDGQTLKLDGIRPSLPITAPVTSPANPVTWEGTLMTR